MKHMTHFLFAFLRRVVSCISGLPWTHCMAEPLPLVFWDYRHAPPHTVYAMPGLEPRTSWVLVKLSTNWATAPTPTVFFVVNITHWCLQFYWFWLDICFHSPPMISIQLHIDKRSHVPLKTVDDKIKPCCVALASSLCGRFQAPCVTSQGGKRTEA